MNHAPLKFNIFVGGRIAEARKAAGMTQEQLASKLGFKDRQILSNIEKGIRQVTPEELVKLAELLNQSLDFFTDPYLLTKDAECFAWRVKPEYDGRNEYEEQGKNLISAHLRFSDLLNKTRDPLLQQLPLDKKATYEEATAWGERLAEYWNMGKTPSTKLQQVIKKEMNGELFFIDAPDEVSGASFRNEQLAAILINRNHPVGRQHFSMAHELFHILTWTIFHPKHKAVDKLIDGERDRSEKLANSFAAGLLMPTPAVEKLWKHKGDSDLKSWLETTGDVLQVSPDALFWRLYTLRRVKKEDMPAGLHLRYRAKQEERPRVYSENFVQMAREVIAQGRVSVRKVARLLSCTYEDLEDLFRSYSLPAPFVL